MLDPKELRTCTIEQLKTKLTETRDELQKLYQLKHTKQVQPNEIKECRKDISRLKTIIYEKDLTNLCNEFKGKKFIPKKLRVKKTKALRNALTLKQKNLKSKKQRILNKKYPKQIYAFTE